MLEKGKGVFYPFIVLRLLTHDIECVAFLFAAVAYGSCGQRNWMLYNPPREKAGSFIVSNAIWAFLKSLQRAITRKNLYDGSDEKKRRVKSLVN